MMRHATATATALALLACGDRGARSTDRTNSGTADTAAGGMGDMGGMSMGGSKDSRHGGMANMSSLAIIPEMRRHMDSMAALPPEQMQAMMAGHQERTSAMLDAMGADMRAMNMAADPAWTALTDSVKRDLADLPGLRGKALAERMREHHRRMGGPRRTARVERYGGVIPRGGDDETR